MNITAPLAVAAVALAWLGLLAINHEGCKLIKLAGILGTVAVAINIAIARRERHTHGFSGSACLTPNAAAKAPETCALGNTLVWIP